MRKIQLLLLCFLVLGATQAQTLTYKVYSAGTYSDNVVSEINGYITTSQQSISATINSDMYIFSQWEGRATYDYYINGVLIGSSTSTSLTLDLTPYIPVTSIKVISKATAWNVSWSFIDLTLIVTPTVALTSGPTVSNVSYYKYNTASPLTATLTGGNTTLKWYTSNLGENYTSTPPTPSTETVGTTTYYVAQANSNGIESSRTPITVTIDPVLVPNISYSTGAQLYTVGTAIANLTPTNTGGEVPGTGSYIYSVSPALPSGLSINTKTGVISGTPTTPSASTNYTISARNESGRGIFIINLRVKAQAPDISYASPQLYTVGTAITNLSPVNKGGEIPGTGNYIYSINPALPSGLSINATTGVISGTPTQASATTDYTITANNESGSSSAVINIRVKAQAPNISYASPQVYQLNTPISTLAPTNTGGEVPGTSTYIYSSSPALPEGLSLNNANGVITGTPTQFSAATNYNITATNESGSSTATVNIKVTAQVPYIVYNSPQTYTVGTAITTLTPTNLGGEVLEGNYVSTFAGGSFGSQNGTGTTASFSYPFGIATDTENNIYVADEYSHAIRKITPEANVSTLAGNGIAIPIDGTGTAAGFNTPTGVAVDNDGNVFVAEQYSNKIRKITPEGVTTTLAGSGTQGLENGIGEAASFSQPIAVALSNDGSTLFVADYINNVIRKVTASAEVSTFAGSGTVGANDGDASSASFNGVSGLVVDASGNVFVADQSNNKIRKITAEGVVSTFAGNGTEGAADGQGTEASFTAPTGLAIDGAGNLYVADQYNYLIRKISATGLVSTIAGDGADGFLNGYGLSASFSGPTGVALDSKGDIYVSDFFNNAIRKITQLGYSITPALPAGLIFNSATGEISGTPTETKAAMDYTVTAKNQFGSSTTIINLATDGTFNSTKNLSTNAIRIYTVEGKKIGIAGIENGHVTIYNQVGQLVFNAKVNGIIQQPFARGIYIVKVGNTVSKVLIR